MTKTTKIIIREGLRKVIAFVCIGCVILNTAIYSHAEPDVYSSNEVTYFEALEEGIAKQSVPEGTDLSELNLPSVLNVELLSEPETTPKINTDEPQQAPSESLESEATNETEALDEQKV